MKQLIGMKKLMAVESVKERGKNLVVMKTKLGNRYQAFFYLILHLGTLQKTFLLIMKKDMVVNSVNVRKKR